jgi:hypothetical protein
MKRTFVLTLLISLSLAAPHLFGQGQNFPGGVIPTTTISKLPAANSVSAGTLYQVTDALTAGGCSQNGGAQLALCRSNGSTWVSIGDGGSTNLVYAGSLPASGLVAEYRMPPTEVSTTTLTDYSGNGNNGTFAASTAAPSRLSNGGLGFASANSQFVSLPTGVNSCSSFLFAYNWVLTNASLYNFFLEQASVQTGTVWGIGFGKTATSGGLSNQQYTDYFTGMYAPTPGSTFVQNSGQGTHVVFFSAGTGVQDHVYLDGVEDTQYLVGPNAGTAGRFSLGPTNWQLGGSNAVGSFGFFNGNIYYAACWNRALAPWEASQATNVVNTILQQRQALPIPQVGLTSISGVSTGADVVVFDGDSIFSMAEDGNQGITVAWNNMQIGTPAFSVYVPASVGTFLFTQIAPNAWAHDNLYNSWANRNIYFQGGGHNDIANPIIPLEGAAASVCRGRRLKGFKCVIASLVSNGGSANNLGYNAWIRQHWAEFADGFMDLGGDPTIGCNTCNGSFVGPHPNIWQDAAFMGYYAQRMINRIFGPQDFTSATTYASSAAAANTVTAASDTAQIGTSGMSTATYTFAANVFTVGQEVTCTGITPAGYNTTFFVATASGTQITGIIPTASLGAGTVFGSCTAPQIEDKYFLLNVSAGTFNVGTACGYTGQRIYFKNISGGNATIGTNAVPNESAETIDGSATKVYATNTTGIWESVVSTPATPQCGWKVIQ